MTIETALQKIKTLTIEQLTHFVQLCDTEIANYRKGIENYPPERMEKHGRPFLARLEGRRERFLAELRSRQLSSRQTDD